jgi:hypothetical protein
MRTRQIRTISFLGSLLGLILASCAGQGVRGQPPFVQVNGLKLQDQLVSLDLGVRNVNSDAIFIEHVEFSISLDGTNLGVYKAASRANVTASGTENLRFELSASPAGVDLLNELQNGSRPNLEYLLEGVLLVTDSGEMKVKREGHVYPVPGRPGQFR